MSDIGVFLKELRTNKRLGLRKAAELSGLSHSYIDSLEKGQHPTTKAPIKPSPDSLKSLSLAYGHSYPDLLYRAGYLEEAEAEAAKRHEIEEVKKRVIDEFDKLPDHQKELIENMIKNLLNQQQ